MESNKLETGFRKKLNEREITPSTNAWDRLDAMLTVAEEKKLKRTYNWLYIAASFIGFLLIAAVFLSQTQELIDVRRNDIVFVSKQIVKPIIEKTEKITPFNINTKIVVLHSKERSKSVVSAKVTVTSTANRTVYQKNKSIVNQKTEQLTSVQQNSVSPDRLIASVETKSKDETPKSSIKVNAGDLLSQVDGELELSFREKVIKTVNKNYKTVKVALANRNQEYNQ